MFDFSRILSVDYVKANGILWDDDIFTYESYWENGYNHYERLFDKPMDAGGKPVTALIYELFPDGTLASYSYYKDGYKYGEDVNFYKSGQIAELCNRVRRCRWYRNGVLKEVTEYKTDGNIYKVTRFDEDGNKLR